MVGELISIIVPVYNVQDYLEKCISSIREQTYSSMEIILVDDGSTDESGTICDKAAGKDERIRVIHKENGGLSDARNAGIDACTGEYIIFVDSDDFVSSSFVESLYVCIKDKGTSIAVCDFNYVDENNKVIEDNRKNIIPEVWGQDSFWDHYFGQEWIFCVVAWNKIYKRELFNEIRYEKGKYHEDEFCIHNVIGQCDKIAVLDEKGYFYRQRQNSIMGNKYTVRRLDAAEAYILRSSYFMSKNQPNYAQKVLAIAIDSFFEEARKNLDFSDDKNARRYKELKGKLRENYRVQKRYFSVRAKLHIGLFLYFEWIYWQIKRK